MKPVSNGDADVNGIKLYHEIYGQGEPLVLISSPYARSCWYPEAREGMSHVGASMAEKLDANTDGQILEAMARAAAFSAVPRQDGEDDERGLLAHLGHRPRRDIC